MTALAQDERARFQWVDYDKMLAAIREGYVPSNDATTQFETLRRLAAHSVGIGSHECRDTETQIIDALIRGVMTDVSDADLRLHVAFMTAVQEIDPDGEPQPNEHEYLTLAREMARENRANQ